MIEDWISLVKTSPAGFIASPIKQSEFVYLAYPQTIQPLPLTFTHHLVYKEANNPGKTNPSVNSQIAFESCVCHAAPLYHVFLCPFSAYNFS